MPLLVSLGVGAVQFQSVGEALVRLLALRDAQLRGEELLERDQAELAGLQRELEALGAVLPLEPDGDQLPLGEPQPPESARSSGTTRRRDGR